MSEYMHYIMECQYCKGLVPYMVKENKLGEMKDYVNMLDGEISECEDCGLHTRKKFVAIDTSGDHEYQNGLAGRVIKDRCDINFEKGK